MPFELNRFQIQLLDAVIVEQQALVAVRGGVGAGKTVAIAYLIFTVAMTRPGARILVVMRTISDYVDILRPHLQGLFHGCASWRARDKHWQFDNGSTVMIRHYDPPKSADEATNPIEGRDVNLVVADEVQQLPPRFLTHASSRARQMVDNVRGDRCRPTVVLIGRPSLVEWHLELVRRAHGLCINVSTAVNRANLPDDYEARQREVMSDAEFEAVVQGGVYRPEGALFSDWSAEAWPRGNVLHGWQYDPGRPVSVAIDLGRGSPAALLIQQVERRLPDGRLVTLDVVFGDIAPDDVLTWQLAQQITAMAWPRGHKGRPSSARFDLDEAIVDPAGHQMDRHSGRTDIQLLRGPPISSQGLPGLGVPVFAPTAPAKKALTARIQRIQRLICTDDGVRRLVITADLAAIPQREPGRRSLARALVAYSWDDLRKAMSASKSQQSGQAEHHIDALGFFAVERRWQLDEALRGGPLMSAGDFTVHRGQ